MTKPTAELVLYRVRIAPGEYDGDGEDHDEWFASKREALRRRRELIAENPLLEEHKYGADYQIDRCVFAPLGKRALLLRVLNRDGMFVSSRVVATEYRPPRKGLQAPVEGE